MFGLSPIQILMVLGIALLVFGAARLPQMARGLGQSMREFTSAIQGEPERPREARDPEPVEERTQA